MEIIRCKDCKYRKVEEHSFDFKGEPLHYCDNQFGLSAYVFPDDFCSYAEKVEECSK